VALQQHQAELAERQAQVVALTQQLGLAHEQQELLQQVGPGFCPNPSMCVCLCRLLSHLRRLHEYLNLSGVHGVIQLLPVVAESMLQMLHKLDTFQMSQDAEVPYQHTNGISHVCDMLNTAMCCHCSSAV
jgi:hypothetical protein